MEIIVHFLWFLTGVLFQRAFAELYTSHYKTEGYRTLSDLINEKLVRKVRDS